jgi:Protein of unknown function (DUF3987)
MPTPNPTASSESDQWLVWLELSHEERLDLICTRFAAPDWYGPMAWPVLVNCAQNDGALIWAYAKTQHKARGGNPFDLQKAVDADIAERQAATTDETTPPPRRPTPAADACPSLPVSAQRPWPTADACPWLDTYVQYSRTWSPRGLRRAHHAVGLWVLSTVAARRITCDMGAMPTIPALSLAMVAPSTLYAKSTTASLGIDLLTRAGLRCLLAADRTTPQALIRSMSGVVASSYGQLPAEKQEYVQSKLAFAAQRGAYMEEWGGMLSEMSRKDNAMAAFHALLRVLDDGQDSYENDTIMRGLEGLEHPYLAVLASATPHDLAPYMIEGSKWWHDGFWARFAFIAPVQGEQPSLAHPPRGSRSVPGDLLWPLAAWHKRLGIPSLSVTELRDSRDKGTGVWQADIGALPQETLVIAPEVADAYDAYNDALLALVIAGNVPQDFAASYGRFHAKALRVALLMASAAGEHTIQPQHWNYAQAITEDWRLALHELHARVADTTTLSRDEMQEQKLLRYLAKAGQATVRDIKTYCHIKDSVGLGRTLKALEETGQIFLAQAGRTATYSLTPHVEGDHVPDSDDDGEPL